MTTGMSRASYTPAAIPACRSSVNASSDPNHSSMGEVGARACSNRATRARRLRTATPSAPAQLGDERWASTEQAVEVHREEALRESRFR